MEEQFDLVKLEMPNGDGHIALFCEGYRAKGLHLENHPNLAAYDIREDEDWDLVTGTLEPVDTVVTNFGGVILVKDTKWDPFKDSTDGQYVQFNDDCGINFLGDCITIDEFDKTTIEDLAEKYEIEL